MTRARPPAGLPRRNLLALAAALLPLAGCGGGESYYTLSMVPGTPLTTGRAPARIEVRTPGVAPYLDREYIVRSAAAGRLRLSGASWAGPLPETLGQTLALDLAQRLPGSTVVAQSGAISGDAQAVVELDVWRFDEDAEGRPALGVTLSVTPAQGRRIGRSVSLTAPVGDRAAKRIDGVEGMVAARRGVVGQLADRAAILLSGP